MYCPLQSLYSFNMDSYSPLPNIHPQDIDCIIRSDSQQKGSLYVSNLEAVENVSTLKKLKIDSIITCAQGYKLQHSKQIVKNYKYIPLEDIAKDSTIALIQEANNYIQKTLAKTNVIVHCLTGTSKSIVVLMAFFMKRHSMTYKDAFNYLKKKRKLIHFDDSYQITLKKYQQQLIKQKVNQRLMTTLKTQTNKSIKQSNYCPDKTRFQQQHQYNNVMKNEKASQKFQRNKSNFLSSSIDESHLEDKIFSRNQKSKISASKTKKNNKKNATENNINQKQLFNSGVRNGTSRQKMKTSKVSQKPNTKTFRTQKSQISQQNITPNIQLSMAHSQPRNFDRIISSSHEQFIGVKRPLKNSAMSAMKQIKSIEMENYGYEQQASRNSYLTSSRQKSLNSENKNNLTLSKVSKHSQSRNNQRDLLKVSRAKSISHQTPTQRSQVFSHFSKSSATKINFNINPQDNSYKLMQSSQQSSLLSPSKRHIFRDKNEKLNSVIQQILTEYTTQSKNIRLKYQQKLKNLRNTNNINQMTSF